MVKSMTQRLPDSLVNGCMVMAKGGPLSVYRTYSGPNSWGGGEVIIPYTLGEAQKWAMEHMDGDAYEAEFGVVEE